MWFALPGFISFVINIIFGILVYYYNRKDITNKTFRNLIFAISLWCFGLGMGYISPNEEVAFKWAIFRAIMAFIIAPCFTHFAFAISRKYNLLNPIILFLIYLPCLISIPMILIEPEVLIKDIRITPFGEYEKEFNTLYQIHGLYLSFCVIIGLYTMISAKLADKLIQTCIFIGFILGCIPCLIIYFILYPIFNIDFLYIGPVFTLTFPCAIAYTLVQPDGIMNVRLKEILGEFVVKLITYILLIFISWIIFINVLYITKWMWVPTLKIDFLIYLPALALSAFVAIHFKPNVYILVYKLIHGHRRLLWRERFLALSLRIKKDCTDEEVVKLIKEHIPKIINTDIYHLLFYNHGRDRFKIIDSNKEEIKYKELPINIEDALIQRINIGNDIKIISEIEAEAGFESSIAIFKRYNIEMCIPIKQGKNLLGIICFGKRNLFPEYDSEQKKEISRFIYFDALPYIRGYLENIYKKSPYITVIYIKDIPDEILNSKNDSLLEYLLNPDKIRIKLIKDMNKVLTKELNLSKAEKIIFNYIVYKAYINDVYDKYKNWYDIPPNERVFADELADPNSVVVKALDNHHGYVPGGSRIRQWVSNIRKVLTEIDAKDLIPREHTSTRGRGKGYTINGKISLLKEL